MTVREARPSDVGALVPLYRALHAEHEALDPRYRLAADAAERWATSARDWTRSATDRVWLAASPPRGPVGLLTAHLYVPAPVYRDARIVHVSDLYVAPQGRGQGLAAQLLGEARAWARAEGAAHVQAGVLAANAAGRAFWAAQGAGDYSVTVTLQP